LPTVSITTIRELIAAGRIVEARTLLAVDGYMLNPEERDACQLEIDKRQERAEVLITQAEAMEHAGRNEEARALYASVSEVAADFPGIEAHIKRMDEALFLARAVQRRNKRIRETVSQKENKKRGWLIPALVTGLVAGLAAAAVILVLNKPTPPPAGSPEPSSPQSMVAASVQRAAEVPASIPSTNTPPPATTPSESGSPLPPPPSSAATQPIMPQVAAEPQPAESLPPAAVPIPASTPTTVTPEGTHSSTATPPIVSKTPSAQSDVYTVQPGDSLSLIAERQLCHEPSWRALYHLNRDQISDPRKLQPGMQLRLNGLERRCPTRP
jgi:LysM repeat protein